MTIDVFIPNDHDNQAGEVTDFLAECDLDRSSLSYLVEIIKGLQAEGAVQYAEQIATFVADPIQIAKFVDALFRHATTGFVQFRMFVDGERGGAFDYPWKSVEVNDRERLIAGGAIRDHLLGIPFNDLDVFILGIPSEKAKELFDADVSTYGGLLKAEHRHETICYTDVDLVFSSRPTPQAVLDDFDLGICKAAWDGSNFILHSDFVTDASRGIITPCGRIFSEHGNRMIKKLKPYGFKFLGGTDRDLLSA